MVAGKYIRTPEIRELHRKAFNPSVFTFKGRHHTEKNKERLRQLHLGKKHSEETKRKIGLRSIGNKNGLGKIPSEESRKKMSLAHKGQKAWNKGIKGIFHHTEEHKQKMSKIMKGEHCHFWKGGITPINKLIRVSREFRLWREAVFKRDNYQCIWCNIKGGWNKKLNKRIILNADHIKPFAYYPELRFAIDNGRTLCESCHRTTETWGGLTKFKKKIYGNNK